MPGNERTLGRECHEGLLYLYLYVCGLTTAAMETQEDSIDIVKLKRVALGQVSGLWRIPVHDRRTCRTNHPPLPLFDRILSLS